MATQPQIKITQLPNIGTNIAGNTLLPVVNSAGNSITEKATVSNLGNVILSAAGMSLQPAFLSELSYSVVNAAQPNITSVGTLNISTLNISGGQNGYVLQTNGDGNLNWTAMAGSGNGNPGGANTQIQFNDEGVFGGIPAFTFDKSTDTLNTVNIAASSATVYDNLFVGNITSGGNIFVGNIETSNLSTNNFTATGNAEANYFIGNGSQLTGITATANGAGPNTAIQFNNDGIFAGDANLTWDAANSALNTVNINAATITGNLSANIVEADTISGNYLSGDGSNITNIGNANYANSADTANVAASANSVAVANVTGIGNIATVSLDGNASHILYGNGVFSGTGNLYANNLNLTGIANISNNTQSVNSGSGALVVAGGIGVGGNIHSGNEIHSTGNMFVGGQSLFVGPSADATGLTEPTLVIFHSGEQYIQAALKNSLATGSADWITYGDNGTDSQGWADMGFTSSGFNDANYTITGPGDGYFFVESFAGSYGGNLVLSTGSLGVVNDIVFSTGGFLTNNEFARIEDGNNTFHLTKSGASITFPDGSIQTTAFTGTANTSSISNGTSDVSIPTTNGPVTINVNGTEIWTFDDSGNLVLAGGNSVIQSIANSSLDPINPNVSTMVLTPDANYSSQALVLDPTAPGHIHLRAPAGTSNADTPIANIFLGGEESSFEIGYYTGTAPNAFVHSGGKTWTFDNTGNLSLPSGYTFIKGQPNGYVGLAVVDDGADQPAQLLSLNANSGTGTTAVSAYANNALIQANIDGDIKTWNFDNTGNLTLPSNTFSVNYANGTQVSLGGSASGNNNEIQFNSNGSFGASANYKFTDTVGGGSVEVGNELLLLGNGTIGTSSNNLNIQPAGNLVITSSIYNWTFDLAGNLTLPSNTFSINYANGTQASAPLVDVLNTNGLSTVYYPTFVENRSNGQIVRADVDLSYRTDTNTLTVGNISATGNANVGNLGVATVVATANISTTGYFISGNQATGGFQLGNSNSRLKSGDSNSYMTMGQNPSIYPDTTASATAGVLIGGNGYLLGNNGSRNITLNFGNVGGVVGLQSNVQVGTGGSGTVLVPGTVTTGVNSVLAGPSFTPLSNTMAGFVSNVNNYTQLTIQNKNTGADATVDFIATADNGTDTVNYIDLGIINSGYDANTPTNSLGNIVFAADGYLYAQGNTSNTSQSGGNLVIGTSTPGKNVKIFVGGVNNSAIMANISNTGITVNGNVTANNFSGNISITGNVVGTSPNVSLVAGSFTATFDNTGKLTLPSMGGDEGGEINLGIPTSNTTLSTRVVFDVFQDRVRFYDGSTKGAYIDLSQAGTGVTTLLNNRVSGYVNAGTYVTMDNLKATVSTAGNRSLQIASVSGSFSAFVNATYTLFAGGTAGTGASITVTTTPALAIAWNFTAQGDTAIYIINDVTNNRTYRVTMMIGGSYNNNMISIERLI